MEMLTLAQIAAFVGAKEPENGDLEITGICRDNRTVNKGDLFVAIRGECFDGHDFILDAAQKGARAALVDREILECPIPTIEVKDTILGLQALATGYRKLFQPHVVGVTGSVGKTTTKEMIASVLSEHFYTLKTMGNMNNEIGLPFTVMGLNYSHQAAVIEMGMNHFGEIARLTRVTIPEIAVITTIGESHIEFVGSKEGVRRAKLEILEGLLPGGTVVLNGDDPLLWELSDKLSHNTIFFGVKNKKAQVLGKVISQDLEHIRFAVREFPEVEFLIHCGGEHNLKNALAAVTVGMRLNLTAKEIQVGLSKFMNTGMRQRIIKVGSRTILNDCYNANPDSMRAALTVLGDNAGRRIAVLGDMLELGDTAPKAHHAIGTYAANNADIIFVFGHHAEAVEEGARLQRKADVRVFKTAETLAEALRNEWRDGDTILVKGSRGMKMERIVEHLTK